MATLRKIPGYIPVRSNVALVGGHFRSWKATSFEKERKGKKKRDQPDGEEEEGWNWRANRCMEIDKLNARIDSRGISVIAL